MLNLHPPTTGKAVQSSIFPCHLSLACFALSFDMAFNYIFMDYIFQWTPESFSEQNRQCLLSAEMASVQSCFFLFHV